MLNKDYTATYTAIDVETPNHYGRSICSIGIVHVESGSDPICRYYLVNPEDEFDRINIGIHGISPSDVEHAPTLPEIWKEISPWFSNGILLAHNASFDLSVIKKALDRYELPVPEMYYICTLQKSRRHIASETFGNYRLDTLCEGLGFPLEQHHNALCDALACASLFEYLKCHFGCDERDFHSSRIKKTDLQDKDAEAEKALNTLHGLLLGIGFDRIILPIENRVLLSWVQQTKTFGNKDIRICRSKLQDALADGIITKHEHEGLLALSKAAAACNAQYCITTQATQLLMGILDGISCDAQINDMEAEQVLNWMHSYQYLRGFYPYDTMFDTLTQMMEDRRIDAAEEMLLLKMIDNILHPVDQDCRIEYNGNAFCLTGNFVHGSKDAIGSIIIDRGGSIAKGVSKKVQYVIVGGAGSEKWAYANYGGKVKAALALIDQGCPLQIVGESALFAD